MPQDGQYLYDSDAEVALLGAMLRDRSAVADATEAITSTDLYIPQHRMLFDEIVAATDKHGTTDLVTINSHLRSNGTLDLVGGTETLATIIAAVATAANARTHARIIRDLSLRRQFVDLAERVSRDDQTGRDVDELLEEHRQALADLAAYDRETNRVQQAHEFTGETLDLLEMVQNSPDGLIGVPSGIKAVDRITRGFQPARFYVIGARPAVGKSLVATDIARRVAAAGNTVAIFSLEMSGGEVNQRLLSCIGRVSNEKMSDGTLDDLDWRKLSEAAGELANMDLYVDDDPSATVADIHRRCERIVQTSGKLDLVLVDYIQLIESSGRGRVSDNRQENVAGVSRALKMLAKELAVPVVGLSQLSRKIDDRPITDRRPRPSDLRDSGGIEQDADVICGLYRDELYIEDSPDRGIIEFVFSKNRGGPVGIAKAAFIPHQSRVGDLAHASERGMSDQHQGGGTPY